VNQTAHNGATPVALADNNGHHEVVKYLIEKAGADANIAQINGFTPLVASAPMDGRMDVARYLAKAGIVDDAKGGGDAATTGGRLSIK